MFTGGSKAFWEVRGNEIWCATTKTRIATMNVDNPRWKQNAALVADAPEGVRQAEYLLLDVQGLLEQGFDTNLRDAEGLFSAGKEALAFVLLHDPEWKPPCDMEPEADEEEGE